MKEKIILAAVFLTAFTCFSFQNDVWLKYVNKEFHFAIQFPKFPLLSQDTIVTGYGDTTVVHYFESGLGKEDFLVAVTDMKRANIEDMKSYLEACRDGSMKAAKMKLIETKRIELDKKTPYIEYTCYNEQFRVWSRIYMIGNVQYSVLAFTASTAFPDIIPKYFDTFKPDLQ